MQYPTRAYQNDHRRRLVLGRHHRCNDETKETKKTAAKKKADLRPNTRSVNLTGSLISAAAGFTCQRRRGATAAANDVRRTESRTAAGVTP